MLYLILCLTIGAVIGFGGAARSLDSSAILFWIFCVEMLHMWQGAITTNFPVAIGHGAFE